MIHYICAICKKELRPPIDDLETLTSHGMCSDCLSEVMSPYGQALEAFLDTFTEPVFVVDENRTLLRANKAARNRVNIGLLYPVPDINIQVFGCLDAGNGCGKGMQCLSCSIRSTVKQTYKTGTSFKRMPCCDALRSYEEVREVEYFISTEKVGQSVFLHVERSPAIVAVP